MLKIMIVFGTRPETIKLAPVIKALSENPKQIKLYILTSGQHDQMFRPLLNFFNIKPDKNLNVMVKNQDLGRVFSEVFEETRKIIRRINPDYLMVQGDTTTAAAAGWAAYLSKTKLVHVEAGLRTGDFSDPYPEEANRVIIDRLSEVLFAPTKSAFDNLVHEGINKDKILVTGNTVIDSLKMVESKILAPKINDYQKTILLTLHRRESFGNKLENILEAIANLAKKFPDYRIIFPIHLNPNVRQPAIKILKRVTNIELIEPLDYLSFLKLMNQSYIILTDSGGVTEEAAYLGKPTLVLRDKSERQESLRRGVALLATRDKNKIVALASQIVTNYQKRKKMSRRILDYGKGEARVIIKNYFLKLNDQQKS